MTYAGSSTSDTYIESVDFALTYIEDLLSEVWVWDPPSELPMMYVRKLLPSVIAPHIKTLRCKQFFGHKFRLGGSKK